MLLFRTLGSVDLRAPQGTPVDALLQQPRRLALLAYLAAAGPGTMVRRDRLLLLFWPELDEGRGRAALSQALHVLRRSLGAPVILTRGNEEVGLEPSAINADIAGFLEALARQDWAAADRLYAGDFLPRLSPGRRSRVQPVARRDPGPPARPGPARGHHARHGGGAAGRGGGGGALESAGPGARSPR
jgi:DNA-binding SARP family transcriptional activator